MYVQDNLKIETGNNAGNKIIYKKVLTTCVHKDNIEAVKRKRLPAAKIFGE